MKRIFVLELLVTTLFIGSFSLFTSPVKAQIIELGDDVRIDFSNERRRRRGTKIRMYPENGRLNVGLEEERRPQTRIRVLDLNSSPSIDVREEKPASEEKVRFFLPF
ncbi:MAG: hypothetical protein ACTMUB_07440 [cyanobacterium endosymbiont of Rhopalodia musculus]|uniref:hypothetical protein n=1 Tax=cyanobacterium endosymbiont of Epithemia clementina EcSB TaxID=3034674 RepID=UPI0024813FD2|nr:hypothetical protein [cyanobacterium endosymbiont of Epithemia clementina EcSB]WGT67925.1 hypothetical protein P3F56_02250 [cyanobacterium endosymbiont of Epithemia clementina EcSB]